MIPPALVSALARHDSLLVAFSGGVDSALLLALAVETLGVESVLAVTGTSAAMPDHDAVDARKLAKSLVKEKLDMLLLELPGVSSGKMFGYPAYYIGKKLFACVYEDGVGIKVPEDLAKELIKTEGITYFQPMGRKKMKQWIQINRQEPNDYNKDKEIFKTSINYVMKIEK